VIGAVVDVEFDDVEDVPDILNALTIKVRGRAFGTASAALPPRLRAATERAPARAHRRRARALTPCPAATASARALPRPPRAGEH
jgi:hypothetical protein